MKKIIHLMAVATMVSVFSAPVMATGDAEKGKRIFNRCKACHKLETGKKSLGPSLAGVFGRTAGTLEGYKYSKAMQEADIVWSDETIAAYLKAPRTYIKKNKMMFPGLKKETDIADLLAYLHAATTE